MAAQQKPEPGTAISRIEPSARPYALRSPVAQLLSKDGARAAIAPMLRPGESYERVMVEVFHAATKNPAILDCTPETIVTAVAQAVSTGLIIGDRVHLVPFGKKLEMVIDYKGAAELVLATGAVRYLDAQCVYAAERFEYEQGSSPFIRHVPITDPKARGALTGAYAVAKVTRDDVRILFMSIDEIDAIRLAKSKSWKQGALDAIPWYAKKTVIKQIVKLLPKTLRLAKVEALLEREDALTEDAVEAEAPGLGAAIAEDAEIVAPAEVSTSARGDDGPITREQKAKIAELLDQADLDQKEREKFARVAGSTKKPMTAKRADDMIAYLTKLVAPASEPIDTTLAPGKVEDALEKNVAAALAKGDDDDGGLPF